jgi:hypothetical protein
MSNINYITNKTIKKFNDCIDINLEIERSRGVTN